MEQVLDAREEQLQWRTGASAAQLRGQRPNLPVIPLPLPPDSFEPCGLNQLQARKQLGIAPDHRCGSLAGSTLPADQNRSLAHLSVLERVARQLQRPLVFIECGPDDKPSPHVALENLRRLCLICSLCTTWRGPSGV